VKLWVRRSMRLVPTTHEASSLTAVTARWRNSYETRCKVFNPPITGPQPVRYAHFDQPRGLPHPVIYAGPRAGPKTALL
jgi:hypothetical protein